jgi:pimeloyl-ACP methyl ester carboxylesterase
MANFSSFDGVSLYYDDQGDGRPVVLLHGFAADTNVNYVRSGILDALLDEGYRTIALDARGHGLSAKPTDPAAYADDAMRRDVEALFGHLDLSGCAVVGYSMGAHTALRLAPDDPRITALALLGIGAQARMAEDGNANASMLEALTADDPDDVEQPSLRRFRVMAGMDRAPLIAMMSAGRLGGADDLENIDEIDVPTILIVGDDDEEAGDPTDLAARLHATLVRVRGDHFTANAHPETHRALLAFLAEH